MGERIQTTNSTHPHDWFAIPIGPLNNIYSSLLLPLIFAKLRTATILVDYIYRSSSVQTTLHDLFENTQTLFRQCLKLSRISIERYANIEYECLLHLARIDRLHKRTNQLPLKTIVQQLLQALQLCYWSSNDGQFIQTCYFELALAFLEQSRPINTLTISTDTTKKQKSKQAASVAIRAATQMALNQKHRYVSLCLSSSVKEMLNL